MTSSELCDAIGDRWYHCCWLIRLPAWVIALGETVGIYFNPVLLSEVCENLLLLNWILAHEYEQPFFRLLSSLHNLVVVPMVTIVGLYMMFKQRRPGMYKDTQLPHGSLYGMPSGDAMFSSMVGTKIFAIDPLFGLAIALLVCSSRVIRGYHTILQVSIGAFIGHACVRMHQVYEAQYQAVSWVLAFVLPFLVVFDKKLRDSITPGTLYNLYSWVVCDLSVLIFDVVVCPPEPLDLFKGWGSGKRLLLANFLKMCCVSVGTRMRIRGTAFCIVN